MKSLILAKEGVKALILAILTYYNVSLWQNTVLGWLVLIIFLLYNTVSLHRFLIKYFNLSGALRLRVLSMFLVLALFGAVNGGLVWVFGWTALVLAISFFAVGLICGILKLLAIEKINGVAEIYDETKVVIEELPTPMRFAFLFLILVGAGFYFLSQGTTDTSVFTPWQTIGVNYIYIFFATTLLSGLLIFSRLKSGTILFLLVAYSFLLHSYLPLSHSLFYGADGWRHIAVENNLLSQTTSQILISPDQPTSFWQRFDFGSLAYAQFNAIALLLKTLGGVELFDFIRWFMPVIWSVVLPIVLFEIARAFNWDKKNALLLVWLSALPFALQVSGSFTLPSNLGVLFWLVCLLLQIKLSQQNTLVGNIFLIFLGLISIFGYSLYFILFWLSFVLLKLSRRTSEQKALGFIITILAAVFLPAIELISNFSVWKTKINWLGQLKAIAENFTAWKISFGNHPSDILTGNIIFNQPPASMIVPNFFTVNLQWVFFFMVIFWVVYLVAIYKMYQSKERLNNFWLQLSFGLLGGYIFSRYFLSGENIFTRRLDAVLAILIILPLSKILYDFCVRQILIGKKTLTLLLIFVISVAVVASYTLGPDLQALSRVEYLAMDNVWTREKNNDQKICVLADPYPLFAMEALSAKKVVGGGFPINSFFAQPEYVRFLAQSKIDPMGAVLASKQLLNVSSCYLVGDYNLPNPLSKFGDIEVYKF